MIEHMVHPSFMLSLHWSGDSIAKTVLEPLSGTKRYSTGTSRDPSPLLKALARRYLDQRPCLWLDAPFDWGVLSSFQARVLKTLLWSVPWGQTITYSRLAALAGHPGSARAVGGCMARNPWPVLVPCHRVVAAGRGLGGFSPGLEMKKDLIALEKTCPA